MVGTTLGILLAFVLIASGLWPFALLILLAIKFPWAALILFLLGCVMGIMERWYKQH